MTEIALIVMNGMADICKKLAENQKTPIKIRTEATKLVEEFEVAAPHRGELNPDAQYLRQDLIDRMAKLMPRILEY
jgi:hypothetical protein